MNAGTKKQWIQRFLMLAVLFVTLLPSVAFSQYIIDNDHIRFGNGSEASINATGNVQQPFYYNATYGWRKLTYSSYPLDYTFAVGGDKTNEWNINGSFANNPTMSSQTIDASQFTLTSGNKGYGTIKVTGDITVGTTTLRVENTYELEQNKSYITVTTKVTNLSASTAENVRFWIGTRDDYVGGTDVPNKIKGNLVDGEFVQISNQADRAAALKIITGEEGVLFYTTSNKGNTIINSCCSWSNVVNQDPQTSVITVTSDGSYGFYVRMNDLSYNQSDEFIWYYAAGELADLEEIIGDVAAASGAVTDITYTTATFNATTSANSTGYYVVVARDATAPTEAQIKAGVSYGGVTVVNSGNGVMTADVERSFYLTSLTAGTAYDLYFVSEDATPAFSEIAKVQFTTQAYTVPTLASTTAAGSITGISATSGGEVSADGGQSVTERGVCWSTSSNPTIANSHSSDGTGTGTFTSTLSGLNPGTLYYIRSYATNSVGTGYGPQVSFSTQAQTVPVVTTASISAVTENSASGGGNVTSDGGATVTAKGICWNATGNPTTADSHSTDGSGTGSFTSSITGLGASTTYFVRAYATNSVGTAYGAPQTFTSNHILTYIAGSHGSISGTNVQSVTHLGNGSAVTAVADVNYHFVNWSDGSTQNPRTDLNVNNSKTVTANFAANVLVFDIQPSTTIAGQTFTVSVKITDGSGNTVSGATNNISLAFAANPNGGVLNGTLSVDAVNGVATFSDLVIYVSGPGYTLAASSNPLDGAVSQEFTIDPADLSYFTVGNIADPQNAGTLSSPLVTAYDIYDNIKTNYTGTIHFTTDDPLAVIPSDYTFIPADLGTHEFGSGVELKSCGSWFVKVNDGLIEGMQSSIDVNPGILGSFTAVTEHNGNENAGQAFSITLTAYDIFGNLKTDYDGSYPLAWTTTATNSGSGQSPVLASNGNYTFSAGTATIGGFTLYNALETPVITATETNTNKSGTTDAINLAALPLHHFSVVCGTTQTAGIPFSVTVTARDMYNNVVTGYAGNISFKSSNDALVSFPAGPQSMAGYNGIRVFTDAVLINTTGTYWFRAADALVPTVLGTQYNIIVSQGAFSSTVSDFTVDTTIRTAGESVLATVIPKDDLGNLLGTGHVVSIMLDGVASDAAGPIVVTDNGDGTYTASILMTSVNAANILSANVGGQAIALTHDIEVLPSATFNPHLVIETQPSSTAVAGVAFAQQPVVKLYDGYNNLISGENSKVITADASGMFDFTGTVSVTMNAGVATFSDLAYEKAGTITATFSASGVSPVVSDAIVVSPAATAYYTLSSPAAFVAGTTRAHYTVSRYDEFGNAVSAGDETVYLYSSSPGADAGFYEVLSGGLEINSVMISNGHSNTEFYYADLKSGAWIITASDASPLADGTTGVDDGTDQLTVDPAELIYFNVSGVDNPHFYGDAQSVYIEAIDIYGNIKTDYTGRITFQLTDADAVAPADYTFQLSDSGTVWFNNGVKFSEPGLFWVTVMDLNEPMYYGYQANIVVLNRPIVITANNLTKEYGEELIFSGNEFTLSEALPYGQQITQVILSSAGAMADAAVGTYAVTLGNACGINGFNVCNYSIVFADGSLEVTPAPLTITPDNHQAKTYGTSDPVLSYTSSGFKLLDDASLLSGHITREAGENTGLYLMNIGSIDAGSNYELVLDSVYFEILPAALTIKAENLSREYGEANPVLTYQYFGFVSGDDATALSQLPDIYCAADALSPVGNYLIDIYGADAMNYDISYLSGVLSVTPAPLTATADDQSKLYGEAIPALSISYNGFKNGETATAITEPTIETAADSSSPVGMYPITLSGGLADNYTLTLNDGQLTIGKAPLYAIANDTFRVYGDPNPAFGFNYTGFIGSDDVTDLNSEPVLSCAADSLSHAGTYPIYLSGGSADNYELILSDGLLTILKAQLIASADDQQRAYGEPNPVFTIQYSGFRNGDDSSIIIEPFATCSANDSSIPGVYPILLSGGSADDYDFILNDGLLTIIKASQSIDFDTIPVQDLGNGSMTLCAAASSGLNVTYSVDNLSVATVNGATVNFVSQGTAIITATQPGNVYFEAAAPVSQTLIITNPTGMMSDAEAILSMYPNPCHGQFDVLSPEHDAQVMITDAKGACVFSRTIVAGEITQINLSHEPGLYMVIFRFDGKTFVRELVVE